MSALISFTDVVAQVNDGPTIEIADARFSTGGLHLIMGANGSGKSAFLKLVLGFVPITGGRIDWRLGERSWSLERGSRLPDSFYQHIGYLQQGAEALWPQFNVFEHIERAIIHRRSRLGLATRSDVHSYVTTLLESLQIDEDKWWRRLDSATISGTVQGFSGGERQRIAFGRAIAARPDVLLLDELEAALDTETRTWLIDGFMRAFVADPNHTAFAVTHDPAGWLDTGLGARTQSWWISKTDQRIGIEEGLPPNAVHQS
jgi:ABC-type multidrug transport system ATPase subunit